MDGLILPRFRRKSTSALSPKHSSTADKVTKCRLSGSDLRSARKVGFSASSPSGAIGEA
jgi:hypothetical protein